MMKKLIACMALALAGAASTAQAADSGVLVNVVPAQGGYELVFELANDDGVTALQFDVALPKALASSEMTDCVAGVARTHAGGCNMVGDNLRILVYSMQNEAIPTGELGRVFVPASSAEMLDATVNGLTMSAPGSQQVRGEAFLERAERSDFGPDRGQLRDRASRR